ncbi:hypothetical protein [Brevibacillus fulvus]|uniref:Uncharacterized protein n=1 Tax=Brevibacillus fulvus TaxID=1125967 RepID=A0A938XVP7_9BACL|nr:hypothetical protein [Brevibacillus fulvus]MBM7591338.1 hypothetical protein [Brevibacillus fulvus]
MKEIRKYDGKIRTGRLPQSAEANARSATGSCFAASEAWDKRFDCQPWLAVDWA